MDHIFLTTIIRGLTASSSMLLTLLLATYVEPTLLGEFFVAQSILLFITQFTRLGLDRQIILRNARRRTLLDRSNVFELVVFSLIAGVVSSISAAGLALSAPLLIPLYGRNIAHMAVELAPALPAFTLLALVSAWLKSEQRPEIGVFFEIGGVNIIMILAFFAFTTDVVSLFIISVFALTILAVAMVARRAFSLVRVRGVLKHAAKALLRVRLDVSLGALNLLIFTGINMSTLLGGLLLQPSEIAQLRLAERVALAVGFPLIVQGSILPTHFAREVRQTGCFCLRSYAPHAIIYALMSVGIAAATVVAYGAGWIGPGGEAYRDWFHFWQIFAAANLVCVVIGPTESVAAAIGHGRSVATIVVLWLAVYAGVASALVGSIGSLAVAIGFALYAIGMRLSMLPLLRGHITYSLARPANP